MRRSFNPAKLNYFLNHRDIFPHIAPDGIEEIDATPLLEKDDTYFFLTNGIALLFWNISDKVYESDIYALSRSRGNLALQAAILAIDCMFGFADVLIAKIPENNKASCLFARKLGYEMTEKQPNAWIKDGKEYDVISFRLDKEKWDQSYQHLQDQALKKQPERRHKA